MGKTTLSHIIAAELGVNLLPIDEAGANEITAVLAVRRASPTASCGACATGLM